MSWLAFVVVAVVTALLLNHAYLEYQLRRQRRRAAYAAERRATVQRLRQMAQLPSERLKLVKEEE